MSLVNPKPRLEGIPTKICQCILQYESHVPHCHTQFECVIENHGIEGARHKLRDSKVPSSLFSISLNKVEKIMSIRRAHPPRGQGDRIRGGSALRKFMLELVVQWAQIQAVVENANFRRWRNHLLPPKGPPRPMFYMRALSLEDVEEMKEGIHFIDSADHQGDYGAYLRCLMTHLVTDAEAPIPSLNIKVTREGGQVTYVEIPLVPGSESPKLPFPPMFTGVNLAVGASEVERDP
ncbi:hypothetical protein Cgig2_031628 [Carnegiea gigantea]|uniref:Uncharacterized protein n=1 Tax=Carnegiea gigantea TaxID=171969 RepID=A0A9Q1K969_9CARY|nr:hypothetical protein Cgig2_031628 [Carnegiea gigantea]